MRRVIQSAAAAAISLVLGACGGSTHRVSSITTTTSATVTKRPPATSRVASSLWPTYHENGARTGAAADGPALGHVRRLWSTHIQGAVYAEPLVVGGRVLVATEEDSVYALDESSGREVWKAQLGTPVSGGSLPCGDIDPSGITGTPAADPATGTLYVVVYRSGFTHVLVALNVATGAVRWERTIDPPGADRTTDQQRAALLVSRGRVYVSYGGLFGDCGRYHGWVIGAPQSPPGGSLISYRVPGENEGGIWAPSGPAADPAGDLYIATGNGSSSSFDYGNAVIRLTPTLQPTSFFAPSDAGALSTTDTDLGSTGPVLLPGARVLIIGKSGDAYLLDARALGGIGHPLASIKLDAAFGGDAYANGIVYIPTVGGIVAVRAAGNGLREIWTQSAATLPPIVAGPGVWALGGSTLYQLDPRTGGVRFAAPVGEPAHFATPAAASGRIYVAAGGMVQAFG
jgi:outer membrane protein assembly factor BamB